MGWRLVFQSSPGLAAGCFVISSPPVCAAPCFNPHPALRPGASLADLKAYWQQSQFQSSPGLAAGCFASCPACHGTAWRFNPHPALRPGASSDHGERPSLFHVSILTRPCGRVLQSAVVHGGWRRGFNPHPALRPGASWDRSAAPACFAGFNPHPALRPGASATSRSLRPARQVSILTRPCGRVLPSPAHQPQPPASRFNPHPALRPGASIFALQMEQIVDVFQSSPGLAAGCFIMATTPTSANSCFNPHPALRPGASFARVGFGRHEPVSILTRPCGRVLRHNRLRRAASRHVSILTRPCGRVLQLRQVLPFGANAFQSSPGLAAGCFAA